MRIGEISGEEVSINEVREWFMGFPERRQRTEVEPYPELTATARIVWLGGQEHEIDAAVWRLMIERGPDVRVFEISGELDLTHEEVVAAIKRLQVTKRSELASGRLPGPEEAG